MKRQKTYNVTLGELAPPDAAGPIFLSMALPADTRPTRYRDQFTSTPTALFKVKERIPINSVWPDAEPANLVTHPSQYTITGNQSLGILFRNPLRSFIYTVFNPTLLSAGYTWNEKANPSGPGGYDRIFTFIAGSAGAAASSVGIPLQLKPMSSSAVGAGNPMWHGPTLYSGVDNKGMKWQWVDAAEKNPTDPPTFDPNQGQINVFQVDAIPSGDAVFTINWYYWNGGNPELYDDGTSVYQPANHKYPQNASPSANEPLAGAFTGVTPGANVTFMVPFSDYWRMEISAVVVDTGLTPDPVVMNVAVQSRMAGSVIMAHLPLPGLVNNRSRLGSMRVNGASLLIRNLSVESQKSGEICALQPPKTTQWYDILWAIPDPYTYLSTIKGYATTPGSLGAYFFIKPAELEDMEFQEIFTHSIENNLGGSTGLEIIGDGCFTMEADDFVQFVINVPDNQAAGSPGSNRFFEYQRDHGGEYETEDQWTETETATTDPQAWSKAVMMITRTPQLHENPLHWRDILGGVKKYGGTALKVGIAVAPLLLKLLGAL